MDKENQEIVKVEALEMQGAFIETLKRNNRKIRDDRALAISEDVHLIFRRSVEDIEMKITRLKRERENMLDLSPDNAMSLVPAKDFDTDAFVRQDISLGIEIRNEEIRLEIAERRYKYLFGGE